MGEPLILYDVREGVAHITLNDPKSLNAVSISLVEDALAAFDAAFVEAHVILLGGSGRAFSSGANLTMTEAEKKKYESPLRTHYNALILRMRNAPIPIIAKVRGAAVGYGASMALAADLVIASDTAFFLQAFRNVGLVPDGGAAFTLVRSVGRIRATEMMLLGQRLPAVKALEWGLITRVVSDDELDAAADEFARDLADGATLALGRTRQMAWAAVEGTLEQELELEVAYQTECVASADLQEGLAAFREKRPPRFVGK